MQTLNVFKRTCWFLIILISGVLFCYNTWANTVFTKNSDNDKTRSFKGDFDKDGIKDIVTITESFGTSTYFLDVTINDGKHTFTYSQEFSSGQFLNPVYIDKKLFIRYQSLFMDSVFRYPQQRADPSLEWLIDASCSKRVLINTYFDLLIKYHPVWKSKIEWPSNYKILSEQTNACMNKDSAILYVYTADNHYVREQQVSKSKDTVFQKENSSETTLLKTLHAVIAKKNNEYSWIFISDENITDGGEKLRWPSIDTIFCNGNLAFILQESPERKLFIVDYEKGLCLRLNEELYNNEAIRAVTFDNGHLSVKTADSEHAINFDLLKKEIKMLGDHL